MDLHIVTPRVSIRICTPPGIVYRAVVYYVDSLLLASHSFPSPRGLVTVIAKKTEMYVEVREKRFEMEDTWNVA